MGSIKVTFKWGKEVLKDVEINLDESVDTLRMQLYSLTNVPPERQKIMGVKGGCLKDDAVLSTLGIKPGQTLMLMGTADEIVKAPEATPVFVEDLGSDAVISTFLSGLPAGITNLGNTCYMNSTLQCLFSVKGFVAALQKATIGSSMGLSRHMNMVVALREVFQSMGGSQTLSPYRFLAALREAFPQFAERGNDGNFAQQDAEECLTQILTSVNQEVKEGGVSLAEKFFGIRAETTLTCAEVETEVSVEEERMLKLPCHIDATVSQLPEGIRRSMEGSLQKNSHTLGRESVFTKKTLISQLPPFLLVQEVRFDWRSDTQKKAKILRAVAFPLELDLIDVLTDSLKQQVIPNRAILEERRQKELEAKKARRGPAAQEEPVAAAASSESAAAGSDNTFTSTAKFRLSAVLTHQGRYADGGHYMAWVQQEGDNWIKFDDHRVTSVNVEEIRKLTGGGDWHMAYILLYTHISV